MKLGEALTLRAYQAQQLNDLRQRIARNATVQEGDSASENAQALIDEFAQLSEEHSRLLVRINRTNATVQPGTMPGGAEDEFLLETLQRREHLRRRKNTLESAIQAASTSGTLRYMRSELKLISTLDVAALQRQIEELTEQIRQVDAAIQSVNWSTDVLI